MPRSRSSILWVLTAIVSVASCGGDDSDDSGATSCEQIGDHLEALCGAFFARQVEVDCWAFGLSSGTRRCLMRVDTCDGSTLSGCNLTDIRLSCEMDSDCPTPLLCDETLGECVECALDSDCAAPSMCQGGLCLPRP